MFHKGSFVGTVVLEGLGDSEPFGEDEGDGLSAEGAGPDADEVGVVLGGEEDVGVFVFEVAGEFGDGEDGARGVEVDDIDTELGDLVAGVGVN